MGKLKDKVKLVLQRPKLRGCKYSISTINFAKRKGSRPLPPYHIKSLSTHFILGSMTRKMTGIFVDEIKQKEITNNKVQTLSMLIMVQIRNYSRNS